MVKQWTCVLVAVVSLKATLSLASTIVRAVPYKVIPGKCRVAHDRPLAPIGVRTTETCGGSCSLLDCRKKCRESATCVAFEYFTKDDSTPTRCELLDEFPSYVESEHYTECYMLRSDVCPLAESDSIMIYAATVKVNGMMNIIEDNGDIYNLGFTDLDHATIRKKVDKICRQNTPVEHHCNLPYFSPRALVSISASDQLVDWGDYDIDGFSYLGEVYAGYEIPENFMNDGFYSLLSNEETEDGLGTKTLSELGIISNAEKFWTGTNNDGTAGAACEGPGGEAWSSVSAGDLGIFGSADTTTSDWQNGGGELSCAETEATILCACTCNQKLQMTMAPTASPTSSPTSSPTASPNAPTESPTSAPTQSPVSKCVTENFVHDQPSSDPRVVANDLMVPGPGVACSAFGERYVVSGFTESSTRNYAQYYVYDGSHNLLYAGSRSLRYKQDLVAAEISDDGLVLVAGFPGYTYQSKQCGMFEVYILNTKTYSFAKSSTEYTDRTVAGEIGRVLNIDSFTDDEVSPRTTNERRFHWPTIATSSLPLREVYIFITTSGKSSGWRECHDCEPITVADPGYDDGFGSSLAVRQHFLLIGAPKTSSGTQLEAGRVYIQKRPGGHAYWDIATSIPSGLENTYNQFAPYMPVSVPQILPYVDNPSCATEPSCAGDRFGEAVAMTRDQSCFIVGAPGAGKAFVFCERYQEVAPFAKFYALVKTFETSGTSETFASKVGIESFEVDGVRQWIATIHDPDNLSAPILVSHSFGHKVFHNLKRVEPTTLSGTSLSGYCHRAGLSAFASNNGITRYARSSTEAGCI